MTIRSTKTTASCVALALSLALSPVAWAKDKPEISYFLSRTDVAVSVAMTLASCPTEPGELPQIVVDWTVVPRAAADSGWPVRVDVSNGFLAKRSNAFEFYPNGTLSEFNGSSEGQGGAFIGSVLRTVAAFAPIAGFANSTSQANAYSTTAPLSNRLVCQVGVRSLLSSLAAIKAEIRGLEDKVLRGIALSADQDLLERKRNRRVGILDQLTIAAEARFDEQGTRSPWEGEVRLPELLEVWFTTELSDPASDNVSFDRAEIEGISGFKVTILPEQMEPLEIKNCMAGPAPARARYDNKPIEGANKDLYYRRPVLAAVVVTDHAGVAPDCAQPLELDTPLLISQWGKVSSLPVGSAGLFGSREASASFDPFGTPLMLSYGSDSGAADIGSTVEAAGGTATAIADADTAALERAIKRKELRQKLRDLRAADLDTGP